ncbi:MAG: bifunctional folylpolyglutamate synthase/dihydrofolate synthase [Gammaproteobacteria bacterium]|nr:bifunctional folylpolyglutamate synthase/dihydrofolate synthase [Gammaproteobacteria bacterium]
METPTLAVWLDRIGIEHPRGVERGLDRVRIVADRLGVVPPAAKTIVVAGTNGKGSTTAFAEHLLLAAGYRVGTTTSPHLHRFNERIRINGREVDDQTIVDAFESVESHRGGIDLSYFEYATLAALSVMSRTSLDYAVLEVGLGGRLDAVNIVDADVAVVTSIGIDHQEHLGGTRETIGREKAGVMRPNVPVVCGDPSPPASIIGRARDLGAPLLLATRDFGQRDGQLWVRSSDGQRRTFELEPSSVDPVNAATAAMAVSQAGCALSQATVGRCGRTVRNPGRLEIVQHDGRTWTLDVAHNPHAAAFLVDRLRAVFGDRTIRAAVGCLEDKDVAGIVAVLRPQVTEFAYADTASPRGRSGLALRAAADDPQAFAGTLEGALAHLLAQCESDEDVLLAMGSFDVVERVRARLGHPGDAPRRLGRGVESQS